MCTASRSQSAISDRVCQPCNPSVVPRYAAPSHKSDPHLFLCRVECAAIRRYASTTRRGMVRVLSNIAPSSHTIRLYVAAQLPVHVMQSTRSAGFDCPHRRGVVSNSWVANIIEGIGGLEEDRMTHVSSSRSRTATVRSV